MPLDDLLLRVKNRKLVMMLAPVIAGVFLGGTMVVKPSLISLGAVRSQKNELSGKLAIFNDIVSWEKKLTAYKSRLAPIEDKAKTIEELGTAAAATGLSVSSITPEEKKAVGTYMERVSVRIDAEGSYHELGEFVAQIENMSSFIKVLSVLISAPPNEGGAIGPGGGPGGGANPAAARRAAKQMDGKSHRMSIVVGLFYAQKDAM